MDASNSSPASRPHRAPPTRTVCVGAVVRFGDGILFVRQAAGHPLAGQWTFPWGFVDPGESPAHAAVREASEEAGIRAEIEGLLGLQELEEPDWLALPFLCRHLEGEPAPDGRETDRAAYLSLADIDALGEPIEPWCEWLARRVLSDRYQSTPLVAANPYAPRSAFL